MRHYFTFDGIKSSDFGVFISGAQTMGAAGRDVDEIVVPGRDGNLTIDNGRFNAVAHTYPAFIAERAKEGLKGLRNALLSKRGHKRLSDTVHPDEFYRAYYEHGLEPEVTANLLHSELEIEFTRDPRRFLVSGDTPQDVAVNTETLSGSVVTFDNATGADRITGLSVSIMAAQSGSGDPSPTNIRPISGWTECNVNVAGKNLINFKSLLDKWGSRYTDLGDGSYNVTATGTGYNEPFRFASKDIDVTLSGEITQLSGAVRWRLQLLNSTGETVATLDSGSTSVSGKGCKLRLNYSTGGGGANYKNIQLELGTVATAYEPYNGASYPVTWNEAGTVYGGTLDVTNGVLTVTMTMVDLGTLNWTIATSVSNVFYSTSTSIVDKKKYGITNLICSNYPTSDVSAIASMPDKSIKGNRSNAYIYVKDTAYTDATTFKAAMSGVQLVYELEEPVTYQLTPTAITTLIGENNIWADCGDVSVTLQLPSMLINPTLFPSSPKIRVHGQGMLYIGNTAITVGGSFPYVDIDTEIADCSYEGQNANQYVTFSGLDFPKLEPGENHITFTGFTAVEVTPRWWRL